MVASSKSGRHVWVTGASSGIGAALASALAKSGDRVSISARSAEKLDLVAAKDNNLFARPLDVANREEVGRCVQKITQDHGPVDLAILNAGVWHPSSRKTFDGSLAAQSMTVNYLGVTHALAELLPEMKARGVGHVAIVASVAGYRGLPKGSYYGPTKAALINLAEALECEYGPSGIKVQIINPGFVKTPMTDPNRFPMPFLMETETAVQAILRGLESNRFEIAFPWPLVLITKISRLLPYRLYFWLIKNVVDRKPE